VHRAELLLRPKTRKALVRKRAESTGRHEDGKDGTSAALPRRGQH
jgi:hypothetical protein